jgi:hypothetical protein
MEECELDLSGSVYQQVITSCEIKPSGFIKRTEILV